LQIRINGSVMIQLGEISNSSLNHFDIKQPVFFADINWNALKIQSENKTARIEDIPKFPAVNRDLAIIVPRHLKYEEVEKAVQKLKLTNLQDIKLFDIFESEKLGKEKKSMAISFTFLDREKTLTDKEIDSWINKIMTIFEKELNAEIRK